MAIADRVAQILDDHGEEMLLKRAGQPDLSVTGKRLMRSRSGGAGEFSGSAAATDIYVRITNGEIAAANWPGPPRIGDLIMFGGRNESIEHVDTRVEAGVVIAHFMYVAG